MIRPSTLQLSCNVGSDDSAAEHSHLLGVQRCGGRLTST